MTIAKQSIDEVRERADIVTEIAARVQLKKAGGNYVGLCPFHGEKSPSFSVSPSKQFFHCFGCGQSGDVIEFLMKHDGMHFHEAVKDLGERLGVRVDEDQDEAGIARAQAARKVASTLEQVCETAAGFYRQELSRSAEALAYVDGRGLTKEVLELYGIGYAANTVSRKALASTFPDYSTSTHLLDAGLVGIHEETKDRYDRFRDRLMFPIRDVRGRCIGFGGRVINDRSPNAPKYLNSPETPIFQKHKILYGLHEARVHIAKQKMAFVSEGYMDVVGMAQYGIGNAVASLGTAFTEDHLRVLLRFTDNICFVFDGDGAGQKAAWKSLRVALPMLEARHKFTYLTLPDGQDPDEYLKAHGSEMFLKQAQVAPTLSQYLLTDLLRQHGQDGKLATVEAKTQFLVMAEELCALIPHGNPLKAMLLQEIDSHVGRAPRVTSAPSMRDRLRHASGDLAGLPAKTPWLPREEWLKQQESLKTGNRMLGVTTPVLVSKSLWVRLGEAAVISPVKAAEMAPMIISLLDPQTKEEAMLQMVLESSHQIEPHPERYAEDQLQAAADLLSGARAAIARQRLHEVTSELQVMRAAGEISDEEYVTQMTSLASS